MADGDEHDIGEQSTLYALSNTVAASQGPEGPLDLSSCSERRYVHRGRLGEGGMGQVDWVWDADLMRDLAVKRLRDELRDDAGLLRRFLWEARVTASLDHPNIVPVHDIGVTPDGDVYFTMKRVAGRSLAVAIRRLADGDAATAEQLPMPRRLRIFMHVCQAVELAHSRGVVHRDLKPDNIMLGSHGEVLVMDWGLAMGIGDTHPLAPTPSQGDVSGTPLYMAPEQAAGDVSIDARADVFSLGSILYELCALAVPYAGATVSEVLAQVKRGEVRPLADTAPDLSPSLCAIIHKAMARDRDDRYASVAELHADVERVVDGRTPEAEHASLATRVARYAVREDPRLGMLRPIYIDMIIAGAGLVGAGVGALTAASVRDWAWPAIAGGTLLSIPFLAAWLKTMLRR